MVKSVQAVCKNSFISIVMEDGNDKMLVSSMNMPHGSSPSRSRSAHCIRTRPEAEECKALSQQSLQRLNAVLAVGMSMPAKSPSLESYQAEITQDFSSEASSCKSEVAEGASSPLMDSGSTVSDLKTLQGKIAKALAGNGRLQNRCTSTCSMSTMASDDASDVCSLRCESSPRLSSMADDSFSNQVEFELDIEAGAQAALEKSIGSNKAKTQLHTPAGLMTAFSEVGCDAKRGPAPKNRNMAETFDSTKGERPTTMMIRNIPIRYSQNDLIMDLDDLGLKSEFDFLYVPMDTKTGGNVGYAFVNFVNAESAAMCMQAFDGYHFKRRQSPANRVACVSVAHLQGLESNLEHYKNTVVSKQKDRRRRPVVVSHIADMSKK
jgi:hypothetical protein